MEKLSLIQTGVDRLVELVQAKHRVSFADAAKELGVPKSVMEGWANFLEEEGIISIEYSFTTPFLTERKLTRKEIETKAKEFHGKKDALVRKAESTLSSIEAGTAGLDRMRQQFDRLKLELSSEIEGVRTELEELKNYERLKKGIDDEMLKQRQEFQQKVEEVNAGILKEQKRYQELLSEIEAENIKLEQERVEAVTIAEQEAKLEENLKQLTGSLRGIQEKVRKDRESVALDEGHIGRLKQLSRKLEEDIRQKKELIPKLVELSRQQEEKILDAQRRVLEKVSSRRARLDSDVRKGEVIYEKFKQFFEHKRDIETLMAKISQDKAALESELQGLTRKAVAFELAKGGDVKGHVEGLQQIIAGIEKKKSFLIRELERLGSLMSGSEGREASEEELKQLEGYVREARRKHRTEEEIRKKLQGLGWSRGVVDKVMNKGA